MKLKRGDIGKIISDIIPDTLLFGNRSLREWYDTNPYRRYYGNEYERRGKEFQKDVLVLADKNLYFANAKPVIIVDGSSTAPKNNKTIYQYDITLYLDIDQCYDDLTGEEISRLVLGPDGKRASISRIIQKSDLERRFMRFATIKDLSKNSIAKVLEDAANSYD